ncbi:Vps54-domain-containing protein [Saccharata proteae CBS 121410]|uniref:Vacuolar protein sorting-associated protein 54 n=1 Tax=Saccharata proteae CBS 121410 TaxID=1314787 RepID=A0A9P4HST7_9PEZI|nr:Vps54-domain-containing protein [Saccharata proteae CBS 121410]
MPPSSSPRRSIDSFESPTSTFSNRLQFPFPQHQHDPARRPSSSQSSRYHQPRRGSTASSIHSIGGPLDTPSARHIAPVTETGQNAISTLLQPPIVRTGLLPYTSAPSAVKAPSTRDIPPVTLTNIPHVEPTAFKEYLSQVGSLYESFQRAKTEADDISQHLFRKESAKKDEFAELLEKRLNKEQGTRPSAVVRHGSAATLSPAETPLPRRRSSGGVSKRNATGVTPLSTIPDVYFEENFHLENPRTFDVVSERSEVIQQPQDGSKANGSIDAPTPARRKALATNAILQEKLSWYMDTVEIHLIQSISTASTSFFAALGSLRELQSEAAESVTRIKSLRKDLGKLDQDMAVGGLKIVGMKRRRENLRKLSEATDQLRAVVDGVAACEELIDAGELEDALDRLDMMDQLVSGELTLTGAADQDWLPSYLPRNLIDLRELKALEGFSAGMQQLRTRVGKAYESRFLEALLGDLRQHIESVPSQETLKRWASASLRTRGDRSRPPSGLPAYLKADESFRSTLLAILNGLSRSDHTSNATATFRDAITREMKVLIRQHLPSSTDDDAESTISSSTRASTRTSSQEKSTILARNLRALESEDAEQLLVSIYTDVGEALRRLSTQVKVLLDVSSGAGMSSPIRSPIKSPVSSSIEGYMNKALADAPVEGNNLQEELMQALDMSSLLGQGVDAAQTQITKILKVRGEQSVRLPLQRFLRYFILNRLFADECEAVSGRSGVSLKAVVESQIKQFVSTMGQLENQRLRQNMDADKWEAKDFGDAEGTLLARILEAMNSDAEVWQSSRNVWEDMPAPVTSNGTTDAAADSNGTSTKTRNATIDEEKYVLVSCAMDALRGIDRFANLITVMPSMTTDVSSTLLDYLRTFQSRTCQLILGAGAKDSAGLKSITTKHLALASQALSFIIALIPYLREFVRRHLPASSGATLAEWDKMRRLYADQQTNIHEKLGEIMGARLKSHVGAMRKMEFDTDEVVEQDVSRHMEVLAKETNTFFRTLGRHLPEGQVKGIGREVWARYKEEWGRAFRETEVTTGAGKARLLRDAEYLDAKLNKLDGFDDLGTFVADIVKQKSVETAVSRASSRAPSPAPPRGAATGSGSAANAGAGAGTNGLGG